MPRRLDNWIEGYLKLYERSEPPILYKKWVAFSVISAVLQRKCYINWGTLTFYPNLYVVLVGPSGKCRKGTAMDQGSWFLRKMGVKLAAEATTREALIRDLAESTNEDIADGRRIIHASLTVYSQELTVFLGYNNQQLMSDITDWYDCRDPWIYRTKGKGTDEIVGVWVNLVGATTPRLIKAALPQDAVGGGLSSRMIFIYETEKSRLEPFPFMEENDEILQDDLVHDLAEISLLNGRFVIEESFIDLWGDWYIEQDKNPAFSNPNLEGYVQRRPNHVMKLCILISAATREDKIITRETLEDAIALLERTEIRMGETFSGFGSSTQGDLITTLMSFIASKGKTTEKEILKVFYADIGDRRTLHVAFDVMKRMDFAEFVLEADGYKITVNPNFKASP